MAASLEEDDEILKNDFYALLNVDRKVVLIKIALRAIRNTCVFQMNI